MSQTKISIIVPIYHEKFIDKFLSHLSTLTLWEQSEVILVSADEKPLMLQDVYPLSKEKSITNNIRLLRSSKGRGVQMNAGAKVAKGTCLLFLHVDSQLEREGLTYVLRCMEQNILAGAFSLCIDGSHWAYRWISWWTNWRSKCTRIPYGDQGLFVHKDVFNKLGGFRNIPIMEDVEWMSRLKKSQYKIKILPNVIRTSARRWEDAGVWKQTLKNRLLILAYFMGVSPEKLSRYY